MLFKLSNLNSNLSLTLGYLNPALNNSAQESSIVCFLRFFCDDGTCRKTNLILYLIDWTKPATLKSWF